MDQGGCRDYCCCSEELKISDMKRSWLLPLEDMSMNGPQRKESSHLLNVWETNIQYKANMQSSKMLSCPCTMRNPTYIYRCLTTLVWTRRWINWQRRCRALPKTSAVSQWCSRCSSSPTPNSDISSSEHKSFLDLSKHWFGICWKLGAIMIISFEEYLNTRGMLETGKF